MGPVLWSDSLWQVTHILAMAGGCDCPLVSAGAQKLSINKNTDTRDVVVDSKIIIVNL